MLFALALSLAADWTSIELPSACAPPVRPPVPVFLADGSHLRTTDAPAPGEPAIALPFATFAQMLEDDLKSQGLALEIQRSSGACLVRGDDAAVQRARAFAAEIESSARALDVELDVKLSGAGDAGKVDHSFRRVVRSGELAFLGWRDVQSYVSSFDVEVAADSGSSEPVVGEALSGVGLHVRACRVANGTRVFVWCALDLAELAALEPFDPETPDLGVLQSPRVPLAQAVFAGVVENGGVLQATLAGTALARRDWKLEIRATAKPDATSGSLALLDLAFLAGANPALATCQPGASLTRQARFAHEDVAFGALPPSAVAAAVESSRGGRGGPKSAPLTWTDTLVFVSRADEHAMREARSFVRGAETARLASGRVVLESRGLRADLPVCAGSATRLYSGTQGSYLVDYRLELAPQIWMPAPAVESAFDGTCFHAWVAGSSLACDAWRSESRPPREVTREEAQVGRMQALARTLRSGAARVDLGAAEAVPLDLGGSDPLALRWLAK